MPTKQRKVGSFSSPRPKLRWDFTYTNNSKSTLYSSQYPLATRLMGEEATITSENGRDGAFRNCTHARKSYVANSLDSLAPYSFAQYAPTPVNGYTVFQLRLYGMAHDIHYQGYAAFKTAAQGLNLSVASVPWGSLSQSALQTMLPSLQGDTSYVNFLLELKDFRSILKLFNQGLERKLTTLEALFGHRRYDKPLARLSKQYLSYSFGWRPLFNDIAAFVQQILGLKAKYDELTRRANRPQQKYWGTWVSGTELPETLTYPTLNGANGTGPTGGWYGAGTLKGNCSLRTSASKGVRYHATLRYRYQMPQELRTYFGQLKATLDFMGINRNPAIVWNAIPFSFIVDWFVNVGKTLDSLRVDNIDFKTEILDFCHSVKIERSVELGVQLCNYHYLTGASWLQTVITDRCYSSLYLRRKGYPDFLSAMNVNGLNYRQFSLAAALIVANKKNRR